MVNSTATLNHQKSFKIASSDIFDKEDWIRTKSLLQHWQNEKHKQISVALLIEYCLNIPFKNIDEIDPADIKKAVEVDSDTSTASDDKSASDVKSIGNDTDTSEGTRQKKEQYNQAWKRSKSNTFTTVKQKTVYNHQKKHQKKAQKETQKKAKKTAGNELTGLMAKWKCNSHRCSNRNKDDYCWKYNDDNYTHYPLK